MKLLKCLQYIDRITVNLFWMLLGNLTIEPVVTLRIPKMLTKTNKSSKLTTWMKQPKKHSDWWSFRIAARSKSPSRNASRSLLAFRSMSLTLSSLVSWPSSLQHTENCVSLERYIPFWSWSQPFSTTYRLISSLHSNGALLSLGTGRKRVIVSVEGWSRLRTQHTSPDLDHWPAKRWARRQQSAGNRTVTIRPCGKASDLYTESRWAAGGVVVSPTQSAAQASIPPIADQPRPGSTEKK